ncbi:hypothetical protein BD311DRAFT_666186 [Dichomitus squalens]|uniref:F-box domain-containing protein n=1 Tax=Dichomitus squalens TaxID=114155 RepID=A0A4Q9MJD3_9APHY|nr:hypothetical protein BD311DRAFT_666186 [Dichomitus squalens]
MDDDNCAYSKHTASRFPVEVCENIIDSLYSVYLIDQVEHSRALHRCALVCRAWRVRSQRNLFYAVVLHDLAAIEKLSTVLDNAPHLCEYVHEVTLIGRTLHTTASPLSLLPIALRGKLPKLQAVTIKHVSEHEDWYPSASELESKSTKSLQYLPLHPRFSLFFSAFTSLATLQIYESTFRHFSDFARMIDSLPALQILMCIEVRCMALGSLPFSMKPRADGVRAPARPFAPNLQELFLFDMDVRCVQRLVSACGPQLRQLSVTMPFCHDAEMVVPGDPATEHTEGVDLTLCTTLEGLDIWLFPHFVTDGQSPDKLKAMLNSWESDSEGPLRRIYLQPSIPRIFTRQDFADLLGTVGRAIEEVLHESSAPPSADGEVGEQGGRWRIVIHLNDWEVWLDWWRAHVQECFPTFARSHGLGMYYRPPANFNETKWKDSNALPPMPITNT